MAEWVNAFKNTGTEWTDEGARSVVVGSDTLRNVVT